MYVWFCPLLGPDLWAKFGEKLNCTKKNRGRRIGDIYIFLFHFIYVGNQYSYSHYLELEVLNSYVN